MKNSISCFFFDDSNVDLDTVVKSIEGISMLTKLEGYKDKAYTTFVTNQPRMYDAICSNLTSMQLNMPVALIDTDYTLLKSKGIDGGAIGLFHSSSLIEMLVVGHTYYLSKYIQLFYEHHDKTSLTFSPSLDNLKEQTSKYPTGTLFIHRGVTDHLFETLFLIKTNLQSKTQVNVVSGEGLLEEYLKVAKIEVDEVSFELVHRSDRDFPLTEHPYSVEIEGHSLTRSDLNYIDNLIGNKLTLFV